MTEVSLPPLHELELAPRRKGFRIAPRGWPGPADATCPEFRIGAADLWSVWMEFAARQPRLVLRARDAHASRSLHVQRSAVLRFPDLVRAEIVALGAERSSLVLDSRARFGCWDFGVNRRRVLRWLHYLKQFMPHDSAKWSTNVAGLTALKPARASGRRRSTRGRAFPNRAHIPHHQGRAVVLGRVAGVRALAEALAKARSAPDARALAGTGTDCN